MFASIRRYPSPSPRELIRQVNRECARTLGKFDGLVGYYVMDSGEEVIAVGLFETQDAAARADAAPFRAGSEADAAEVVTWS